MYVQIIDDVPVKLTRRQLIDALGGPAAISLPDSPSAEMLAGFNAYPLTIAERPEPSLIQQVVVGDIAEADGVWVQGWTLEYLPLEDARLRLWGVVKAIRDEKELSDSAVAPTPFGDVQCNDQSKLKISGLVQMALIAADSGQPFAEDFTMADNSVVTLDATMAVTLGLSVGQYVSALHERARELRTAIESADNHSDLEAIDMEAGWP